MPKTSKKAESSLIKEEEITTTQEIVKKGIERHFKKYNYKLSREDINDILLYHYLDNTRETRRSIQDRYNIIKKYYYKLVKNENSKKQNEAGVVYV